MTVTELPRRGETSELERVPPHDLSAEQCVLGGMMLSKDAVSDVIDVMRPGDHYRPAHQLVHETILDLYGRGEPADAVTVAAELTRRQTLSKAGGGEYLHTLIASVPTAANAGYYAGIVKDRALLRRLAEAGTRITQDAFAGGDGARALDRAQAAVYAAGGEQGDGDMKPMSEIMPAALERIEEIAANGGKLAGIPTGIRDLDGLLGGLHNGQFVIIAARPAIGKSVLATDFVRSAGLRQGLTTVMFSLEMPQEELVMRMLAAETRIPLNFLRSGDLSDADWLRLAPKASQLGDAPVFIDDSANVSVNEIRAKCRRLKQKHDLKLVVIDYLQLMSSPGRPENRQQEVSEISRGLKLLAKELHVPVVALSQLNRGPEARTNKQPFLSDLRESGCLTEDTTLLRADTGAPISFRKLLDDGHEGVLVWSLDERRRLVAAPLTNVFPSGVKEVFRLTMRTGRTVKATGNHKFLTFDGWKPLADLTQGDHLAIPRRNPEPLAPGLGWSEERIGLLAHLIGDGCVLLSQPVHYTSEDEANLGFVDAAAKKEFGITARRVPQGNWQHTYLPAPRRCARGRRNPLHVWFRELGIENLRSHEKRIPDALYSANTAEVAVFLRHLWATDGRVAEPSSARSGVAALWYSTSSRALADGVTSLLARFGIVARVSAVMHSKSPRPNYRVAIMGGPGMRTFCREIGVHGSRAARAARMLAEISGRPVNTNVDTVPREVWQIVKEERKRAGFTDRQFQAGINLHYCGTAIYKSSPSRERLMRIADLLDSDTLRGHACDDVFWDEVTGIESLGVQPVYDATVKGTHNFIADGVVAHNSLEQDADVVILLHREDAYERESPRAGEADLIVAKHRNGPTATITCAFQGHYSRFVDMAPDNHLSSAG